MFLSVCLSDMSVRQRVQTLLTPIPSILSCRPTDWPSVLPHSRCQITHWSRRLLWQPFYLTVLKHTQQLQHHKQGWARDVNGRDEMFRVQTVHEKTDRIQYLILVHNFGRPRTPFDLPGIDVTEGTHAVMCKRRLVHEFFAAVYKQLPKYTLSVSDW